jgi:two-component system cell cycle response regulator
MNRSGQGPVRDRLVAGGGSPPAVAGVVLGLLVLLSLWEVGEQLSDTVAPSLLRGAPYSGVWPDVAFALAGLLLILRGRRTDRGWALIGFGALCWAAGDVYWQLKLSALSSPPVPSWADAGYLSFCPFAFAGILSLVRGRTRNASRTLVADAAAAALATGAVSAALVVEPVMAHARGGVLAIATNLAYPICDLALVGLLIGAMAVGEWRLGRKLVLLGAAVVAFWVADSGYLVSVATGTYSQSDWYNGLWYVSPVLAAWAGWVPAREATGTVSRGMSARGIVMLLGFAVTALVVLCASSAVRVGPVAIGLAALAILVILARLVMTWRENIGLLRHSQHDAITDTLTGLRNRRALTADLRERIATSTSDHPLTLVLLDLDGFKHYNDSFGHPAGDALLKRLGQSLSARLGGRGSTYRMGGDEFCALIDVPATERETTVRDAADALSESGEGFAIGCSYGSVILPDEADSAESALRLADIRMYAHKRSGRASASRQSKDVLLRALHERNPTLHTHLRDVAQLAAQTARSFGLPQEEVEEISHAAELHDVGKVAIPDAILDKPAPLDENEWAFIRRHTLIGERIIIAAPALTKVGALVRSSHEHLDGSGYPDRLKGDAIPLGSRIISVCDAYDAMTADRPYRQAMSNEMALAELHRCAGTQFDQRVVEQFCLALSYRDSVPEAA